MNRFDASLLEHISDAPIIDLHGLHVSDAREKLNLELNTLSVNKSSFCRIVHGIGSGILAALVEEELSQNPLIEAFFRDSHGGSTTVRFYPHI